MKVIFYKRFQMSQCELCQNLGHITFECDSERAKTIDEAVNNWFSQQIAQYQSNSGQFVHKELLIESDLLRQLSEWDFLYLLRHYIDAKNWQEFSKMYNREKYMYLYLGYQMREYTNTEEYETLSKWSKMRIYADYQYWLNRAHFDLSVADELWDIDLENYTPNESCTNDCPICLRNEFSRRDMAVFNCGHNFCRDCCHTLIVSNRERIVCPMCREHIHQITQYQNGEYISIQII